MKIIDARSGRELKIGDTVEYDNGESFKLLDVDEGLFSATAFVEQTLRVIDDLDDGRRPRVAKPARLITRCVQIPLIVRILHPDHLFRRVAFIPS